MIYWKCRCDCGKITSVRVDCLKKGTIKSCGCKQKELHRISAMIDISGQRFGQLTAIEPVFDYAEKMGIKNSGNVIYWKFLCDCKREYICPGTEVRSKKRTCCPHCSISHGEKKIEELLELNNVSYIHNKIYFEDLENPNTKCKLKYDFIVLDEEDKPKYIIEYDGEQHFFPINYFGGEERYIKQKELDRIKNNYAFKNKIPIIRIPYTIYETLNYEDINILTSKYII